MKYRHDVDGLRALAIVLVIIFHAFPQSIPNGYLGVDIFFVISGFLITSIIYDNLIKNKFSFTNFYIRRIKRIFPIAIIVLGSMIFVASVTFFDSEFKDFKKYLESTAGFYVNFVLENDIGYFEISSKYKPMLHFWSLAIEEQFYLIWPLLLFIFFTLPNKVFALRIALNSSGSLRFTQDHFRKLNLLIIILTLAMLALSLYTFLVQTSDIYFSSHLRLWELLAGCVTALILHHCHFKIKFNNLIITISLMLIALSLILKNEKIITVLAVLGTALFLFSNEYVLVKKIFKLKPVVYIGSISYSLYLWHWPLFSFYRIFNPLASNIEMLILTLISFGLSALSYKYIELPLKNINWDLAGVKREKSQKIKIKIYLAACCMPLLIIYTMSNNIKKLPDKVINKIKYVKDDELNLKNNCILDNFNIDKNNWAWCYSENKENKNSLVIGDSHAHSIYRGLVNSSNLHLGWELIAHHNCSPFYLNSLDGECNTIIGKSYKHLLRDTHIENVLIVMANRVFEEYKQHYTDEKNIIFIANYIKALTAQKKKVYVLRPTPEIAEYINNCINQRFSFYQVFVPEKQCQISLKSWQDKSSNYNLFIDKLKQKVPDIQIIDPLSRLCFSGICSAIDNNNLLYQDKDHLTMYGSKKVSELIYQKVNY